MLALDKFDVLLSVRKEDRDKGVERVKRNIEKASILTKRILVDCSYPVSYSRFKLLQQATTPWVICLDDDVIIGEDWLTKLSSFVKEDVVAVEGLIGYGGKPRLLRKGERSYGFWNLLIRTDVAKEWHPRKWVRSWEDYQIGQHCLKYGKWVRVPVEGKHLHHLDMKKTGRWSGRGCRDALGVGSVGYLARLFMGLTRFIIRRDRYGTLQNLYGILGLLSR